MSLRPPCPLCGADNALRPCGERVYHPPRWLRWLTIVMHEYLTRSYICEQCGEVSEIGHVRARSHGRCVRR